MIGTRGYLCPEILQAKAYGLKCDIWSLGCLLYALLSARLPFWADERREMNKKVINEAFDTEENASIAALSPAAKDLLCGMLAKNPNERLDIDQVLAHEWLN